MYRSGTFFYLMDACLPPYTGASILEVAGGLEREVAFGPPWPLLVSIGTKIFIKLLKYNPSRQNWPKITSSSKYLRPACVQGVLRKLEIVARK